MMRDHCDWKLKQSVFLQIQAVGSGFICISPDKTASSLLQLEARPRSRDNRCIYAELGNLSVVCRFPMVSDTPLPCQRKIFGCFKELKST